MHGNALNGEQELEDISHEIHETTRTLSHPVSRHFVRFVLFGYFVCFVFTFLKVLLKKLDRMASERGRLILNNKLDRTFYFRDDTVAIARDLLGKLLVVPTESGERVSGMIVETEAYLGEIDRAAHSYGGRRTARNEVTYGEGGHVYVFFIYGMYYQLNVVCGQVNSPHVVLIRAVEPVEGIEIMRERRSVPRAVATGAVRSAIPDKNLTSGPGKLCIAFGIDRRLNGEILIGEKISIEKFKKIDASEIVVGPRVGIDYAGEDASRPLRFSLMGNSFVSKAR